MGVLAAILTDAGRVALDVAGIERCRIEGRGEQQRDARVAVDELLTHLVHGPGRAHRVGGTRQHRPGLRDGIDAAFVADGGPQRRAVIEKAAPVPVAVPGFALHRAGKVGGVGAPCGGTFGFLPCIGQRCEGGQRGVQKPRKPHALALAPLPHPVHAVIPVAGADQRQAMHAVRKAVVQRTRAVLEHGGGVIGHGRLEERVMFVRPQLLAFQKRHFLIQQRGVAADGDVLRHGGGQPRAVV